MKKKNAEDPRLSPRQQAFVSFFLETGNATKAAKLAGYSERSARQTAWRMLHENEAVIAAIEDGQRQLAEASFKSAESLMRDLDIQRIAAERRGNNNAAVRALELQARILGLLIERRDTRAQHQVEHRKVLSAQSLEALMKELDDMRDRQLTHTALAMAPREKEKA